MFKPILCFFFFCFSIQIIAQNPSMNKSVRIWAVVQNNPPQIQLHWQAMADAVSYNIQRKIRSNEPWADFWQNILPAALPNTQTTYNDTDVQVGLLYEYRITKNASNIGYGYINAGIEIPEKDMSGIILLVYDSIGASDYETEMQQWEKDMMHEGRSVWRIPVDRNESAEAVKQRIVAAYQQYPQEIKSIMLLGRVPVPYSGNLAPDGHQPDHLGAWPADAYYADMDGNWTDVSVNNSGASQARNRNIPGDGKFDQNVIPSDTELEIGRVDMRNLGAFSLSENQLIKQYLNKNHAYRNKHFTAVNRALIDDNFTTMAEGFAASAWRSFGPLCHPDSIVTTDYFTTMKNESYLWSYGCGAGSYTNCNGIGNTAKFASDSLQSVFTMLFGSYFGDWDSPSNNLLRASLANGTTLTNAWSGRPFWYMHHMALGETIGFSARASINNSSHYDANIFARGIFIALMGDPTLKASVIAPPTQLIATYADTAAHLTWTASADNVLGYNVYAKTDSMLTFIKLNSEIITSTYYVDSCLLSEGIIHYLVRPVKLETTASGSFYHVGIGVSDTVYSPIKVELKANFEDSLTVYTLMLTNTSAFANSYTWHFGDGNSSTEKNPSHSYANWGIYTVQLIAFSACGTDTFSKSIEIPFVDTYTNTLLPAKNTVKMYPNPLHTNSLQLTSSEKISEIQVLTIQGALVFKKALNQESESYQINLPELPNAMYVVRLQYKNENSDLHKLIINRD
jgi:PKD repeat protein